MRTCVLASGSKGNVTYVETNNHKILIDIGTNVKYIKEKLLEIEVLVTDIDIILISHIHNDHIKALEQFIKKYNPYVYMTSTMVEELEINHPIRNYEKLILCEIICHANPSPKVFKKYIDELEKSRQNKVVNIFFRNLIRIHNIN